MPSKHTVDDSHFRVVSDDGRSSDLYESSFLGGSRWVETARHNSDGTTDAYEAPTWGEVLTGLSHGAKK